LSLARPTRLASTLGLFCSPDSKVIEAESQAVTNTLTEHDFQDTLKNSIFGFESQLEMFIWNRVRG
jgi:hypothetical protein